MATKKKVVVAFNTGEKMTFLNIDAVEKNEWNVQLFRGSEILSVFKNSDVSSVEEQSM